MRGLFITGTDTDVGKTYIGARFTQYLYRHGFPVQPRKPVESGCIDLEGIRTPADALAYHQAVESSIALDTICPYRFLLAASPPEAALQEGKSIKLAQLHQACISGKDDYTVVEGAGGFYSPIAEDGLNADLAQLLDLDVLVVTTDRLGAVNQTLLTVEAIHNRGLSVCAVILNQTQQTILDFDNATALKTYLDIPIHRVPYAATAENLDSVFKSLTI